jgi:phospholipase/lecithinase/hemolysin
MSHLHHCQSSATPRKVLTALLSKAAMVAAISFGLMAPNASFAEDGPQFVAFGDSLLDAGTYSPVAEKKFGGGRYTTNPGSIFPQLVARFYGDELKPAFVGGFGLRLVPAGGLDYAQGGSRVTMQPGFGHPAAGTPDADFAEVTTIPVKDQVAQFLKDHKRFNPNQVIFLNGGANDIFYQLTTAQAAGTPAAQQAAQQAIAQSATDLAGIVATVVSNGATHVVLINMPDIGKVPFGLASVDQGQSLTQISQLFNATLVAALQQQTFGDKVLLLDAFTFQDNILATFQQHGFRVSNTAFACDLSAQVMEATKLRLNDPSAYGISLFCSPRTYVTKDADQSYIFADTVHPSTHMSALIAEFVEQQIEARHWEGCSKGRS